MIGLDEALQILQPLGDDELNRLADCRRENRLHDEAGDLIKRLDEVFKDHYSEGFSERFLENFIEGIEIGEKKKENELIEYWRQSGFTDEQISRLLPPRCQRRKIYRARTG